VLQFSRRTYDARDAALEFTMTARPFVSMAGLRRMLGLLLAVLALVVCVSIAVVCFQTEATGRPDCLGNSPEHVQRLVETAEPTDLLFYVVGVEEDPLATLEALLRIVRHEEPDFIVLMDDLHHRGEDAPDRFILHELSLLPVSCPVFVVQRRGAACPNADDCGPAQFHFRLGNHLFLFGYPFAGASGHDPSVETVLRSQARPGDDAVVFSPASSGTRRALAREVQGLGDAVRYAFIGAREGYWKGPEDSGASLTHVAENVDMADVEGKFRSVVRVVFERGRTADTMLAVELGGGAWRRIRESVFVLIWPLAMHSRGFWILAFVVLIELALAIVWQIQRRRHVVRPGSSRGGTGHD